MGKIVGLTFPKEVVEQPKEENVNQQEQEVNEEEVEKPKRSRKK